jgi:hypothetical protein
MSSQEAAVNDGGWDIVVKKPCFGASHCNDMVELSGSFTYRQKHGATKEECDEVIEAFLRMIKISIAEEKTDNQK